MSDNQMVSVPRELLERACMRPSRDSLAVNEKEIIGRGRAQAELREILAKPAEQHQGEPVAYASRTTLAAIAEGGTAVHWLSHEPKGADCVPLYTHADPAEVERLRAQVNDWTGKWEKAIKAGAALERKLAERDALLREIHDGTLSGYARYSKIEAVLSASAEPRAPTCGPGNPCAYPVSCGCQGAPVERDERAEFESYALDKGWLPHHLKQRSDGNYEDWGVNPEWQAWKARAALERKP